KSSSHKYRRAAERPTVARGGATQPRKSIPADAMLVGTLLAAWLAVTVASGAKIPVDDEEPKGCAFRGQVYAVGERWATGPPNKCAKYICEGDDQIAAV
ncbi:hypothetical protein FOCC_FOCC003801, partial [Frankliniella occidentalis]